MGDSGSHHGVHNIRVEASNIKNFQNLFFSDEAHVSPTSLPRCRIKTSLSSSHVVGAWGVPMSKSKYPEHKRDASRSPTNTFGHPNRTPPLSFASSFLFPSCVARLCCCICGRDPPDKYLSGQKIYEKLHLSPVAPEAPWGVSDP